MSDFDLYINVAPERPSGVITVTLIYGGRGKPSDIFEERA